MLHALLDSDYLVQYAAPPLIFSLFFINLNLKLISYSSSTSSRCVYDLGLQC